MFQRPQTPQGSTSWDGQGPPTLQELCQLCMAAGSLACLEHRIMNAPLGPKFCRSLMRNRKYGSMCFGSFLPGMRISSLVQQDFPFLLSGISAHLYPQQGPLASMLGSYCHMVTLDPGMAVHEIHLEALLRACWLWRMVKVVQDKHNCD